METKQVSRSAFVGSHVGVIVFHVLLGLIVLFACSKEKLFGFSSNNVIKTSAYLLIIVSLLGLVPVVMNYNYNIN